MSRQLAEPRLISRSTPRISAPTMPFASDCETADPQMNLTIQVRCDSQRGEQDAPEIGKPVFHEVRRRHTAKIRARRSSQPPDKQITKGQISYEDTFHPEVIVLLVLDRLRLLAAVPPGRFRHPARLPCQTSYQFLKSNQRNHPKLKWKIPKCHLTCLN